MKTYYLKSIQQIFIMQLSHYMPGHYPRYREMAKNIKYKVFSFIVLIF